MVLPLGKGYPLDRLASALGNPPESGIITPFPVWLAREWIMELSENLLKPYLTNLINSLRDDGFANSYILMPTRSKS